MPLSFSDPPKMTTSSQFIIERLLRFEIEDYMSVRLECLMSTKRPEFVLIVTCECGMAECCPKNSADSLNITFFSDFSPLVHYI